MNKTKRHYEKMKANGLCVGCGKQAMPGKVCCRTCADKKKTVSVRNWRRMMADPVKHEEYLEYRRHFMNNRRLRAMKIVAGSENPKCSNCGCDVLAVLEINHINGNGRIELHHGGGQSEFYGSIVSGKRRISDLNILCRPCNWLHFVELKHPELKGRFCVTWEDKPKV